MADARLVKWLESVGLPREAPAIELLDHFQKQLYEQNEKVNLTRIPEKDFWVRHVVDSLLFEDLIPRGATVLDIGTGAGFPAWPLAWARPDLRVTAIDSSSKAIDFLSTVSLPNLEPIKARAEEWGIREKFDAVTGRAVAPFAIQMEISAPPCKVGGVLLPMRTPSERKMIEDFPASKLRLRLDRIEERELPEEGAVRLCPVFKKTGRTPATFPRPWVQIRSQPL